VTFLRHKYNQALIELKISEVKNEENLEEITNLKKKLSEYGEIFGDEKKPEIESLLFKEEPIHEYLCENIYDETKEEIEAKPEIEETLE
jgi:hypothetical protein